MTAKTRRITSVCVFAASSDTLDAAYTDAAAKLGALLADAGYALVYGGGNNGLMGAMARTMHQHGGHIVGVIPEKLRGRELAYDGCGELIVTADLRERKAVMEQRADAFIALPGGLGTLEETLEILTLRQLHYHDKPVLFLNTCGAYDGLFQFFETLGASSLLPPGYQRFYHVARTPEDALALLNNLKSGLCV